MKLKYLLLFWFILTAAPMLADQIIISDEMLDEASAGQEDMPDIPGIETNLEELSPEIENTAPLATETLDQVMIQEYLSRGNQAYLEDDYQLAIEYFQKALEINPDQREAFERLESSRKGLEREFQSRMNKAEDYLKAGKKLNALWRVDLALELKPADEQAQMLFEQLKGSYKALVRVYIKKGDGAARDGDKDLARRYYLRAQRLKRDEKQVQLKLDALDSDSKKEFEQAVKAAGKAEKKEKWKDAIQQYQQALRLNSESELAKKGYERSENLLRQKIVTLLEKGKKLYAAGKTDKAEKYFLEILDCDSDNRNATIYLEQISSRRQTVKKTAKKNNKKTSVKTVPVVISADEKKKLQKLYYQGVDKYVSNELDAAVAIWEKVLQKDPNHHDARNSLKRARAKQEALKRIQ